MKPLLLLASLLILSSCGGGESSSTSSPSALCNDGTYSYSQSCSGTCSSHGGVREWYVQCGPSGNMLSRSIDNNKLPDKTGAWKGKWINKRDDTFGPMELKIVQGKSGDGILLNNDNSVNSRFHSYYDENGTISWLLDAEHLLNGNITEYPADISFALIDGKLKGTITLHKIGDDEIKDFELHQDITL